MDAAGWGDLRRSPLFGGFLVLCGGVWLHAADTLVMATLVPAVVADIGGIAYVAWTIALYQIGAIVAGAATAPVCARIGLRRVLAGAAALYGVGCVVAALAPGMGVLLGARFAQGLGGGILVALNYIAIQQSFGERLWGRLFAVVAVIWAGGSLLGPLIGGVFADLGSWRGAFWCFALQAAVVWVLALRRLPADRPEGAAGGRFSVMPVLVLSGAALLIAQAGLVRSGIWAVVLAAVGLVAMGGAGLLDRRAVSRLLPVQAMDLRHPVGTGLFTVFALSVATTGFWAYGPLLLKILFGTDPLVSGYILAGEALAWSVATLMVSGASRDAGRGLIRAGVVLVAVGAGGFAVAVPEGSLLGMIGCGVLQGLGFGLCWPAIVQRVVQFADASEGALAAAAPATMQRIGYAVGAAASGIAANASGLADGMSVSAARVAGFWVFAGFIPVLIAGVGSAWWFTRD
jgi:MFS family permease